MRNQGCGALGRVVLQELPREQGFVLAGGDERGADVDELPHQLLSRSRLLSDVDRPCGCRLPCRVTFDRFGRIGRLLE